MRYLEERKAYTIWYEDFPVRIPYKDYQVPAHLGLLLDHETEKTITLYERWLGNKHDCIMKLGKKLIKKWKNKEFDEDKYQSI